MVLVAPIIACSATDGGESAGDDGTATTPNMEGQSETSVDVTDGPSSTGASPPTSATSGTSASSGADAGSSLTSDDDGSGGSPVASSAGSAGSPEGCYDYDAFEPTTVGFRADVMPIFAASCSPCHSDPTASIYFGMGGTTETEASAIHAKLLDGVPKQAPHLAFVAPADPLHSYMLAKVEYAVPGGTCSEVQCDEPGCELPAPPASPLAESDKAILRSWVIGGALDD